MDAVSLCRQVSLRLLGLAVSGVPILGFAFVGSSSESFRLRALPPALPELLLRLPDCCHPFPCRLGLIVEASISPPRRYLFLGKFHRHRRRGISCQRFP